MGERLPPCLPRGAAAWGLGYPASRPTAGQEWGSQGHPFSSSAGIYEAQTVCPRRCASLRGHGPVEQPDVETLKDSEVFQVGGDVCAGRSGDTEARTPDGCSGMVSLKGGH